MTEQLENHQLYILNEQNIYITKEYIESTLAKYDIKYQVKNLSLFQIAVTHISYLNRDLSFYKTNKTSKYVYSKELEPINDPKKAIPLQEASYERLEFVGDSVLHLILADYLWTRYETQDEGFMTRLRTKIENGKTLAHLSKVLGLSKYLLISSLMEKGNNREKNEHILEDAFEAFIAALFLDSDKDYNICHKLVITLIEQEIDLADLLHMETNFKDILLQYFHQEKWHDPTYDVLDISGPEHKKQFTIYVKRRKTPSDDGEIVGTGIATSKKKAEQYAAKEALIHFNIIKNDDDIKTESYESFSEDDSENISIIDDDSVDDKNYNLKKIDCENICDLNISDDISE